MQASVILCGDNMPFIHLEKARGAMHMMIVWGADEGDQVLPATMKVDMLDLAESHLCLPACFHERTAFPTRMTPQRRSPMADLERQKCRLNCFLEKVWM